MAELNLDELVCISDLAGHADLSRLRLVSKTWCTAVGCSKINLRPKKDLTSGQLIKLCSTFWKAPKLDLTGCQNLDNSSLKTLQRLSNTLSEVLLGSSHWLTSKGVAHLTKSLARLEVLDLSASPSLTILPDSISQLTALRELRANSCNLRVLPEGIQDLKALQHLSIAQCRALSCISEGISGLSFLQVRLYPSNT